MIKILLLSIIGLNLQINALTLKDAVEISLRNDNNIKIELSKIDAANAGLERAKMSRFGGFNLKSMYTDGTDPVYVFATTMKQGNFSMASMANINDPSALRNYMFGLEAGFPIFTGFALSNNIKMAEKYKEISKDTYERTKSFITFKTTWQWLNVLLFKKLASLAEESVTSSEAELKTALMLKEKGMVLGSDYYGAEAILSTIKGYRLNWSKTLELEREKLAIILGIPSLDLKDIEGDLVEVIYSTKTELIDTDLDNRFDIKAYQKMVEVSKLSFDIQKNSLLPVVEAFGSWETNSNNLSDFKSNRILGLRISVPVGDPTYFAKKDLAKAEISSAENKLSETYKQAKIELTEAYRNYYTAKENLPIAKETVEKAQKSYDLFLPLYRQGRQSVLEVLRAKATLLQAQANYYETIYKIHLYYAQILLATERMNMENIKEISLLISNRNGGQNASQDRK